MSSEKKLSKNVRALGVVSLFNDASSDMVYPLIPLFLTSVLGASYVTVGVIEGIAESTASLLKIFSGWLSDRFQNRKTPTVIGYGLSMIAKPLLGFAQTPFHVLLVRFSDRFGKGIRQAPRDALIAESADSTNLGHSFGFHKMMDTIGATVGPILAFILLRYVLNGDLRSLFFISFIASACALLTLILFVKEQKKVSLEPSRKFPSLTLRSISREHLIFLCALAIFSIGNSSDAFLMLRAKSIGISEALIPLLYASSNIVFALSAKAFGRASDKINPYKIIFLGYIVFSLIYFGFAWNTSISLLWLLFPLYGLFPAMTESLYKTVTVRQTKDSNLTGSMLGLTHMVIGLCQFPASLIAGALWGKFGPQVPFLFSGVCAVLACVILLTQAKRSATT